MRVSIFGARRSQPNGSQVGQSPLGRANINSSGHRTADTMTDHTDRSIWDYRNNLCFDEPLETGDERLVELSRARGDYSRERLYRQLGVDTEQDRLRNIPRGQYLLFGGHCGCGKSTELRIMAKHLGHPDRFFVVFIDALKSLDVNNLKYRLKKNYNMLLILKILFYWTKA